MSLRTGLLFPFFLLFSLAGCSALFECFPWCSHPLKHQTRGLRWRRDLTQDPFRHFHPHKVVLSPGVFL